MELYNLVNTYSENFIPVFIRIAVMFSFMPFIGARTTPVMIKAGLMLAITFLVLPIVEIKAANPLISLFEAFFTGLAMGLAVRLVIGAFEMAAQWMSLQMGMGMAAVFNPQFGETLGPLSLFYSIIFMTLFFMLDFHHVFIEGIVRSFEITSVRYENVFQGILKLNSFLFQLAFKIAAPVLLVQMMINIGLGFLAKALPQANVFFISFPLTIGAGIIFVILSLPLTFMIAASSFMNAKDAIMAFTR